LNSFFSKTYNLISNKHIGFYLIAAALCLVFKWLLLPLIIVFPAILIIKITKQNFLISAPLALIFSVSLLLFEYVFLAFIDISIGIYSILILHTLITSVLYILKRRKVFNKFVFKYSSSERNVLFIIYSIFAVAVAARFLSLYGAQTPALHDPEAHSWFTKLLLDSNDIEYLYSPGLHIISGFLSETLGLYPPRAVHLTTQFFNAFSVLSWGLAVFLATRNRYMSLAATILAFVAPLPAIFYSIAGKNALVLANAFLPFVFVLVARLINKFSGINLTLLSGLLMIVGFIHLPTFPYVFAWSFLALMSCFTFQSIKSGKNILKPIIAPLATAFVIVGMIVIGWTLHTQSLDGAPREERVSRSQAQTVKGLPMSDIQDLANKNPDEVLQQLNKRQTDQRNNAAGCTKSLSLNSLYCESKQTFSSFKSLLTQHSSIYLALLTFSLVLIIFLPITKESISVLLWGLILFAIPTFIELLNIKTINIVTLTGFLLIYQFLILLTAVVVAKLLKLADLSRPQFFLLVTGAFCLVVYNGIGLYDKLRTNHQKSSTVARQTDLDAYKWIDRNIPDEEKFLIAALPDPNRASVIFPIDGGMWLPIYTENDTSFVFHTPGFASVKNHLNLYLYSALKDKNISESKTAINEFYKHGYRYYYEDAESAPENARLPINELQKNGVLNADLIYSNQGVNIYELSPATIKN
jgi:hypothetical protein